MKLIIGFVTWIFGLACGLSIASWLIASERIGDAIVFVYLTNGLAVLIFTLLTYLLARHYWSGRNK